MAGCAFRAGRPRSRDQSGGTPALPGGFHPMTSSHQAPYCRSILVPLGLKQVHLLRVYLCLFVHWWFVFIGAVFPRARQGGGTARASRPHPVPLTPAELRLAARAMLQCDAAGSHPIGGNNLGQAEGEAWCCSRLIPVGGDGRGCAGLGAGGTPALPGSHHCAGGTPALPGGFHPMRSSHQGHTISEAFWYRLPLILSTVRGSGSCVQ